MRGWSLSTGSLSARVLKALGVFSSTQALSILCTVVRTKLVAIWIGSVGLGLFGLFSSAVDMISAITHLSLRSSSVREISALPPASPLRRLTVAVVRRWGRLLGLGGMLLTAASSPLLSLICFGNSSMWWAFVALSPVMFMGSVTGCNQAILQADNRLKSLALIALYSTVTALILAIPILYWFRMAGIVPVIVVYALSSLLFTLYFGRTPESGPLPRPTHRETITLGRSIIKLGVYMTISGALVQLTTFIFMSWLNNNGGTSTVGLYQAGNTLIIRYAGILFTAIGMEYFPRIAAAAHCRNRLRVYANHEIILLLKIALPLAVVLIIGAPFIIRLLFAEEFASSAAMVEAGTPGLIFKIASWCISYMMIVRADGRVFLATEIISSVMGLVLNILFFSEWGVTGLGASFTVWYLLYLVMVWGVCRWRYRFHLTTKAVAWLLTASVSVSVVSLICLAYIY